MARTELAVATREVLGKKVAKLRRGGVVPANVYGHGLESVAIQITSDDMEKMLKAVSANEVLDLKIKGEPEVRPVVIQKLQRHPLTSSLLHADFYQVSLMTKMRADVPLVVVGQSEAIETYNGVLMHALEAVHVEALPLDLPSRIEVDITPLANLEDALHVSDLPVPANVTILNEPEAMVLKIATPRIGLEEEEMEAAEAAPEAEEAAEGEAADVEEAGGEEASEQEEKE